MVCHQPQVAQELGQIGVVDGIAAYRHPLVDALDVGAGINPDGHAPRPGQRGDQHGYRALAVGSGDVDCRVVGLGVAQRGQKLAHGRQRQAVGIAGSGLQVDVAVQPRPGLGQECGVRDLAQIVGDRREVSWPGGGTGRLNGLWPH